METKGKITALLVFVSLLSFSVVSAQNFPLGKECGSSAVYQNYVEFGVKSYSVYFPKERMDNIIGATTSAGSLMGIDCYFSVDKEGNKGIATVISATPQESQAKVIFEQTSKNPIYQNSSPGTSICSEYISGTSTQGAGGVGRKNNIIFSVSVDKLPNVTVADVEDILRYACDQVTTTSAANPGDSNPTTPANPNSSNPAADPSGKGVDKSWLLYVIGALILALIALIVKAMMSRKAAPGVIVPPPVAPVAPTPEPVVDPKQTPPPPVS